MIALHYLLNPAGMLFPFNPLLVIINTHEQYLTGIFRHFPYIVFPLYLRNGCLGILGILQLKHYGRPVHMTARNQHQVSEPFSRSQFTMNDIIVPGRIIRNGEYTTQRVLIMVGKNACLVFVNLLNSFGNRFLIACQCIL